MSNGCVTRVSAAERVAAGFLVKIARFNGGRVGVVKQNEIFDVTAGMGIDPGEWPPMGMVRLIADFAAKRPALELEAGRVAPLPLASVSLETPVPWPNKLIAIPVNYHAHALEMSSPAISRNAGFFILSNSSLSGASEPVVLPDLPGRQMHHEAELAIIIGNRGRHISAEDALDYVFGYSCLFDMTVRGKQERAIRKSYDTFTPVGPYIVTADEVGEPDDLQVQLWVNEQLRQDANTRDMILSVRETIAMCSAVMTLEPGDIIASGTGEGVGPIAAGDTVRIEITRVGGMSVVVEQGTGGGNIAIPTHL
jgi:2-keto-4-pentenoate hydratase/2-oxohepta-3-ene-1,7-dioic acid hydratase in catechol pathway